MKNFFPSLRKIPFLTVFFKTSRLALLSVFWVIVFSLSASKATGQDCFWAKQTGGIDYDYGRSIVADTSGYVYVAGHFYGTGDFDPGTGIINLVTKGGYDIFLSKFDTSGVLIWEKQIGGKGNDYVNRIFLDKAGNVYLSGSFSDTVDFDPDTALTTTRTSNGGLDAYITKFDADGNFIWAKTVGGPEDDFGNAAGSDNNNYVYLTGTFSGTGDFLPGAGVTNLTSVGGTDIFLLVLDSAGTYYNAVSAGGTGDDDCKGIAVTYYGEIYLTGGFSGTANLNPLGTYNLTSSGGTDIFLVRMGYYGALYFYSAKKMGGPGNDKGLNISLDLNNYEYLTGYFEDSVDFNPASQIYNLYSNGGTDIFVCKFFYGTNFSWGASMGGPENDYGYSVVVDPSLNVFTTGSFSGTADFDPDANTVYMASQGMEDIFISKLDQMGNFSWSKQMGGTSSDEGHGIALDASGNIYTTGHFSYYSPGNTVDFDPGSGSSYLSASGSSDVFFHRLDASGNYMWAFKMGSGSANSSNSMCVDASGNVYYTGFFSGTADFDPGPGMVNFSSAGSNDIFVSKVDASGNLIWAKAIGSTGVDIGNEIIVDSSGFIYLTGYFSAAVDFDPGPGDYFLTSVGGYDVFILKLDSAGNFVWAKQVSSTSNDFGISMKFSKSGKLVIVGNFQGTIDADPGAGVYNLVSAGSNDIFILQLDTSGTFMWAKEMGGVSNESVADLCIDKNGSILTTGYFYGFGDFDPGAGVYSVQYYGLNEIFVSKLDSSGNFLWANGMGGTDTDMGFSIAVDDAGSVYAGGNFNMTADLDPGPATLNFTSVAGTDLFLVKFDSAGNFIRVISIGSSGSENVNAIIPDGEGNVFFTGNFGGPEADFDPGSGVYNVEHFGKPDAYFCKYDTAFNFLWAKGFGGADLEQVTAFSMDALGNLFATGRFRETSEINPGDDEYYLTSQGYDDIFLVKYHPVVMGTSDLPVSCFGGNDGSATVLHIDGVSPYTYAWSDGEPTQTATALSGGNHYVTVTDSYGCSQVSDSVFISQPLEISSSMSVVSPVSCFGGNNGNSSVSASGGTGSLQYDWSNGDTLAVADSLSYGTVYLTVTDANSCTKTDSILVSQPTAISSVITSTLVSCNGGTNGTATVNPSGGTSPFTYLWNTTPSQNTQTAINLKGQTYLVTITDFNGCTRLDSVSLANPPLLTSSMTKTKVSCYGGDNGSATVNPSGGTSPYTYYWNIGQTGQTATGLFPGNYAVNVLDAMGCSTNNIVSIGQPMQPSLSLLGINVTCYGDNTGIATANPSGGTTPYSYLWSTAATTKTITGLTAGTYYVTVSDSCNISGTDSIVITQPAPLTSQINSQNVKCFGAENGWATASGNGGKPPYTFSWSTGGSQNFTNNLSPGTYYVTITDACSLAVTDSVFITEPAQLVATNISHTDILCNGGGDGTATVTPAGGTSPYTFNWSSGQTAQTAVGLFPGTYGVNVFDSKGCLASNSVTITQPSVLTASTSVSYVSCNAGSDGMATVTASGGSSPYTYLWNDPANSTTAIATGLSAGSYSVTVSDSCGASVTQTVLITQPGALSLSSVVNGVKCNGQNNGSASVSVSGGVSPYTYAWSNNATSANISLLGPGTYYVTVSDFCAQSITDSVTVSEPIVLSTSLSKTDVTCYGFGDGSATVTPSGGTSPYTIFWNNNQTTATSVGLFPGTYSVNVVDANGCFASGLISINQPGQLSTSTSFSNVSCHEGNNGTASVTATGGSTPYTYLWNDTAASTTSSVSGLAAGSYSVTVSDSCGASVVQTVQITQPVVLSLSAVAVQVKCNGQNNGSASVSVSGGVGPYTYLWSNNATSANISLLGPGTYFVTVSDFCAQTSIDSVSVSEPVALSTSLTKTDVTCYGIGDGSATVTASGGTSPYTYLWNNNQTNATAVGLYPGTYSVNVVDANGCFASGLVTISQPGQLSTSTSFSNVSCHEGNNGTASVTATGGSTPYTYLWNDSAASTTSGVSGLVAGSYSVTVSDSCGASVVQTVQISEPGPLATSVSKANVSCFGVSNGTANLAVSGGVSPYTYLWSTGSTNAQVSNLTAQSYFVTATDFCGLTAVDSVSVTEPAQLNSSVTKTDITCHDFGNGTATVSASGGTTPYTYQWSNGQSLATAVGLFAGNYSVNVFDANFCLASNVVSISQPGELFITISTTSATCGGADATASATPVGGTPFYSYEWSNGDTTSSVSGLPSSAYYLTITDANGCTASENFNIGVVALPQEICLVTVDSTSTRNLVVWEKPMVNNIDSFRIYRDIVGNYSKVGTVAYQDLSKFVDFTNGIDPNITSYRYKITAVDTCGNESDFSSYHKTMHLTKNVGTQGEVNLIWDGYEGFSSNFYYRILKDSTGSGNFIAIDSVSNSNFSYTAPPPTTSTQYLIEVVHPSGGCSVTKTVENHNSSRSNKSHAAPPGSSLSASTVTTPATAGNCDGTATVTAVGGETPYFYQWDGNAGNQTTETATGLCPGTFSVLVTDGAGSTTLVFATVGVLPGINSQNEAGIDIKVFPNPNGGEFTVEVQSEKIKGKSLKVEITNILGEKVYESQVSELRFPVSIKGISAGIFNLRLISEDGVITKRIIVE